MSDKDTGSEDKKGKADQPEANSSSSKPSMSFKDMYAKYESFSLKQSISRARETANEYLAKIPKAVLPKVDETAFDVLSRPLHNFSEKMEMDYPYLADIARSHGAELVAVPTISAAYLLRRLPRKLHLFSTLSTLLVAQGGVTAINYKWWFPK